ncbi:Nudix family hydrolase [Candidatus Thiothrix anitrata]|jgi:8-oxo-dGTP diphosphatase|uniref:8-oxo-dGTP diphosphatase n=1 Tax=Candidatus Thiothrix anitrata TaxID=2823902 RepID=A0ABX7X2T8_9GAMM|nr:Nudix family hydrolase [Candidatus Thiothrix anitrata]QTR50195.1 Nudix family hydrolase [Candidatus Thiothrix anitrata]
MSEPLYVVAAVIRGSDGRILLAQRPNNKHQGGKWEFPGGKLEAGETPLQALGRELQEELGITPRQARPLIKVRYAYPERSVLLDVWEVTAFQGVPHGCEGQPVAWFSAAQLPSLEFPAANAPIVTAALLPDHYLITPEPSNFPHFLSRLENCLQAGVRLVQFRAKSLNASVYLGLAQEVIELTHAYQCKVMVNSPPLAIAGADGVHLTSRQLQQASAQILESRLPGQWLSAACHNVEELARAAKLGVDFALLAPVLPTRTHPGMPALGWRAFQDSVDAVNFPVYALGGLNAADLATARQYGGQGIAAIRGLWGEV